MKRVYFFVLLTNVSLLLFSQNLAVNPGFEIWEKSTKPLGWATVQSCIKDSVNIKSGSYSCRHEGGTKYLGQTISIVPGKQYRLSFFYKTVIAGSGNGCRIWCYWKDMEGNNLTDLSTDNLLRPSKYLKSETFQQFAVDFIAPVNSASFYLEVRTYQNSTAYLDDFVFEENVATYTAQEILSDIKIYPNPAHDYLNIYNIKLMQHIDIISLTGEIIWSSDYSEEEVITIPVSGLVAGIYIVRIQLDNKLITRKFIKKNFGY